MPTNKAIKNLTVSFMKRISPYLAPGMKPTNRAKLLEIIKVTYSTPRATQEDELLRMRDITDKALDEAKRANEALTRISEQLETCESNLHHINVEMEMMKAAAKRHAVDFAEIRAKLRTTTEVYERVINLIHYK